MVTTNARLLVLLLSVLSYTQTCLATSSITSCVFHNLTDQPITLRWGLPPFSNKQTLAPRAQSRKDIPTNWLALHLQLLFLQTPTVSHVGSISDDDIARLCTHLEQSGIPALCCYIIEGGKMLMFRALPTPWSTANLITIPVTMRPLPDRIIRNLQPPSELTEPVAEAIGTSIPPARGELPLSGTGDELRIPSSSTKTATGMQRTESDSSISDRSITGSYEHVEAPSSAQSSIHPPQLPWWRQWSISALFGR